MQYVARKLSITIVFALIGALASTVTAGAAIGTSRSPGAPRGAAADRARAAGSLQAPITGPWSALGSNGSGDGALNSWVDAVAVSGTDVYVGGAFTDAGGVSGANYIAKWDGVAWSAVGAPGAINGEVQALAVSGNNLYAGGRFTNAAGVTTADYVAKWNGHTWSALGSNGSGGGPLNHWVHALAVDGSTVYVGGAFTNAGGVPKADYLASWNGSAWSGLGSDGAGDGAIKKDANAPSPTVFALAVAGTDLFVGGSFINVAGIPEADNIARWNGSNWFALGAGEVNTGGGAIEEAVYALAVSGTDLYVGGAFINGGTLGGDRVAMWNGTSWSPLGTDGFGDGLISSGTGVTSLAVAGSDLYVGGDFSDVAGISAADDIARWDGAAWSAVGSDGAGGGALTGAVSALAVSPSASDLYVGGYFWDTAGIGAADQIAVWGPPVVVRRPDGRIRLAGGAYVGDNVYNATGAGQSRTGSALAGHSITFGVSIQNDGTNADRFLVKATGVVKSAYGVRYYSGTTDITAAVVAGTYETASLAPGASVPVTAKVSIKSTATKGSSVTRLVTLTSVGDAARGDAVMFVGKRS